MIYLDIIATDEPDSLEITGSKDHQWMGLKDTLNKPKLSLWKLWGLKKFIETSYERLNKEPETESAYVLSRIKGVGSYPESEGGDASTGTSEPESGLVGDKG